MTRNAPSLGIVNLPRSFFSNLSTFDLNRNGLIRFRFFPLPTLDLH